MAALPITETNMADFVPVIIAGKALMKMKRDMVFSRLAYVDFSADLKQRGDTVQIPKLSTFEAKTLTPGADADLQDMNSSKASIVLDNLDYVHFLMTDVARAKVNQNLIDRLSEAAARALLEKQESKFADLFDSPYITGEGTISVTTGSATVTGDGTSFMTDLKVGYKIKTAGGVVREVTAIASDTELTVDSNYAADEADVAFYYIQQAGYANGGSMDDSTILLARSILRGQGTPINSMSLVANLTDYSVISSIDEYIGADSINAKILVDGMAGRIRGFNVFESNFMDKEYSPAFNPMAIGVAFRILDAPQAGVVESGVVFDPETGMSIRYVVTYDSVKVGYRVALDMLSGMSIIDPEQVVRVAEKVA